MVDMRRKRDVLVPLEVSILESGILLRQRGVEEFHGFAIAKELRDAERARSLTAHGTLYKALERMERSGLLESHWENPLVAAEERRPRRRLYRVTGLGERALRSAAAVRPAPVVRPQTGIVTT
jgi:DNA-binding PadR family transcriptional regulator